MSVGEWAALNMSHNASRWMLRKDYAVNGTAYTQQCERVTARCEAGDDTGASVWVSHFRGTCELLIRCPLLCDAN